MLSFRKFLEVHYNDEDEGYDDYDGDWGYEDDEETDVWTQGCENWTAGGNWGLCGASGCIVIAKDTGRILVDQRGASVDGGASYGTYGGAISHPNQTPEDNAKEELGEETSYHGPIQFIKAFRYEDRHDEIHDGTPWFYQNFIAIVPKEFNTTPKAHAAWETYGGKWVTMDELEDLEPKHPGLEALIQHSIGIIRQHAR